LARFRGKRRAHDRGAPRIGRALPARDRLDDDAHAVEHGAQVDARRTALALGFEHLAQQVGDADQALVARERAQERLAPATGGRSGPGSWSTDR
jgi:hypothetical protein